MRNEMTLIVIEFIMPVVKVFREVHLLGSPKTSFSLQRRGEHVE
jgi:hypothetical protein